MSIGDRDLIGRNYYDLVPVDAFHSHCQDVEVIISGRPMQGVLCKRQIEEGIVRWMGEDRFPLRDKMGKVIGVMVFAQDVTECKLAEERL